MVASSPPARAVHQPWGDPCFKFFFEESNRRRIDIREYVDQFVTQRMKLDGYGKVGGYEAPSDEAVKALRDGFNAISNGDLQDPAKLEQWRNGNCPKLVAQDYAVRPFIDTSSGRDRLIWIMYEIPVWFWNNPQQSSYYHGWGLYVIGPPDSSSLAVEVPHACPQGECDKGDGGTHVVGAEAFAFGDARYLFVNGTPRIAAGFKQSDTCDKGGNCPADVAHQSKTTIFQVLHEEAVKRVARVYQPHGFGAGTGSDILCGKQKCDVVVSSGSSAQSTDAKNVAAQLQAKKFLVCLYDDGNDNCDELGATSNRQRKTMNGKSFVSVEVRSAINMGEVTDDKTREKVADTVACVLRGSDPSCL